MQTQHDAFLTDILNDLDTIGDMNYELGRNAHTQRIMHSDHS